MGALRSAFVCRQGRELISLRLDDELSELEQARLDSHLRVCPDCRAFEAELTTATRMLRGAELEPVTRPVVLPQRRRLSLRSLQVGTAAALVVVAAGLGTLLGPLRSHQAPASLPIILARQGDNQSDLRAQRMLRRQQRAVPPARLTTPRRRGGVQPV
jgi:predicted anti-sigma-YlaC factor YlaD